MNRNPSRGCGQKAEGSCYGEGPEEAEGGILRGWTWLLGNGIDDVIQLEIPPLVMVICNPAATIAARALVKVPNPTFTRIPGLSKDYDPNVTYERLKKRTKTAGMADHVGQMYTVYSYARETNLHGPSRKIPPQLGKDLAQILWQHGPIPLMAVHSRMPVFNDHYHLEKCVDIVADCLEDTQPLDPDGMEWVPTWELQAWSQYATTPDDGRNHILIPILHILGEVEKNWKVHKDDERYQKAREFFKSVRMVEQPFGLAWLAKITYTADKDGDYSTTAQAVQEAYGDMVVDLLDLKKEE